MNDGFKIERIELHMFCGPYCVHQRQEKQIKVAINLYDSIDGRTNRKTKIR